MGEEEKRRAARLFPPPFSSPSLLQWMEGDGDRPSQTSLPPKQEEAKTRGKSTFERRQSSFSPREREERRDVTVGKRMGCWLLIVMLPLLYPSGVSPAVADISLFLCFDQVNNAAGRGDGRSLLHLIFAA